MSLSKDKFTSKLLAIFLYSFMISSLKALSNIAKIIRFLGVSSGEIYSKHKPHHGQRALMWYKFSVATIRDAHETTNKLCITVSSVTALGVE